MRCGACKLRNNQTYLRALDRARLHASLQPASSLTSLCSYATGPIGPPEAKGRGNGRVEEEIEEEEDEEDKEDKEGDGA
eukprot:7368132-Pyramimonas_sp.AAC.1